MTIKTLPDQVADAAYQVKDKVMILAARLGKDGSYAGSRGGRAGFDRIGPA